MGIKNGLAGVWEKLEDPYYRFLEWLDDHGISVFNITDPIDAHIPSLLIFLVLILVIAGGLIWLSNPAAPALVSNRIVFVDSSDNPLFGVSVEINSGSFSKKTVTAASGEMRFELQSGSKVQIKASRAGLNPVEQLLTVPKEGLNQKIELASILQTETFSIQFAGTDNRVITGKKLRFVLSCSNQGAVLDKTDFEIDSDQKTEVNRPENCGALIVSLKSPSEYRLGSYPVSSGQPLILLQPAVKIEDAQTGSILVSLFSEDSSLISQSEPVAVLSYNNRVLQELDVVNGSVRFSNLPPGPYSVLVYDSKQAFSQTEPSAVLVQPNSETIQRITVSSQVGFSVKAQVTDGTTNQAISRATVRLVEKESGLVVGQMRTANDGTALFNLEHKPNQELNLAVLATGFFSTTVSVNLLETVQSVVLKPVGPNQNGLVLIRIQNEQGEVVENAKVYLLDEAGNPRQDIAPQISDALGKAAFSGVPQGTFIAWAKKGFDEGQSAAFNASEIQSVEETVVLKPGNATLQINATDEQQKPLAGAKVTVFNEQNKEIAEFGLDDSGKRTANLSAGQTVRLQIEYPGFLAFRSQFISLISNANQTVNAVLVSASSNPGFKIRFTGFKTQNGKTIERIIPASLTYAFFELTVPQEIQYSKTGVFIRLEQGSDPNDWTIQNVQTPGGIIFMGNAFSPPDGETKDLALSNLVSANGQWTKISFSDLASGTYSIAVGVKTRADIESKSSLKLHFNAWAAEKDKTEWVTLPEDLAAANNSKPLLYADSFEQPAIVGSVLDECILSICLQDFRAKETANDQWLLYPFELRNNREYEFLFSVSNSGENSEHIALSAANQILGAGAVEIQIGSYNVETTDGALLSAVVNDYATAMPIEFDLAKLAKADIRFILKAQASQPSQIALNLALQSGGKIEKTAEFLSAGNAQFQVSVSPSIIPVLTETPLEITVTEKDSHTPVSDASVLLQIISPDNSDTSQTQFTTSEGKANFLIPQLSVQSSLKIQVSKNGFETIELEQPVGLIVQFVPDHLQAELDLATQPGFSLPFVLQNQSSLNLLGQGAELSGPIDGVLDLDQLSQTLSRFKGLTLAAQNSVSADFFSVQLDPNIFLSEDSVFETSALLYFKTISSDQNFVFSLPLTLTVHATQGINAAASTCLTVTPAVWNGVLQQNQSALSVTVSNQCASDNGEGIDFNSLEGRIEWPGFALGNVEMELQSQNSGDSSAVVLKKTEWQTLANNFAFNSNATANLTFTPTADTLGQTAEFNVVVSGKTKNGRRFVAAPIVSKLLIANLKDCLMFTPKPREGIAIPFGGQNTFSVDSSQCGSMILDIALCKDDPGCMGGASKGKINVMPSEFSLSPETPSQTVTVSGGDLPGAYGITVFVATQQQPFQPVALIDAVVDNDPAKHFSLNKFEFFVKNKGTDSATLTNNYVSKPVTVSAPAKVWAEIAAPDENGLSGMQAAGDGLDPNAIAALTPALAESRNAIQQLASQVADSLDQAGKSADTASQQTNDAAQKTSDSKDQVSGALDQAGQGVGMANMIVMDCAPLTACASGAVVLTMCPTAKADAARICASAQSLFGGIANAVKAPLSSATEAIKGATKTMGTPASGGGGFGGNSGLNADTKASQKRAIFASIGTGGFTAELRQTRTLAYFQGTGDSVNSTSQAQQQLIQGRADSAVASSSQASNGAALASQQAANSCQSSNQAAQQDKQAQDQTKDSSQNQASGISGLGQNIAQAAIFETNVATAPCLNTWCQPQIMKMRQTLYTFKGLQTALQGASQTAKDSTDNKAQPGQQQSEQASKAAAGLACETSKRLREFADATPAISKDSGDANDEIMQNITNASNAQGLTDGLTNGIYRDEIVSNVFSGYLINLVNDGKEITADNPKIKGKFNTEQAKVSNHYKEQKVGVVFENTGLKNDRPVYSTVTIKADQHDYAEPQSVPLGETDWGAFRLEKIGTTTPYEQEFHLKFNASENAESDFGVNPSENRCVQGSLIGQTTAEALPKIKLSWKWSDISADFCDAANPNYNYCDASQLAIVVSKRLNSLHEFLSQNRELSCPENPYEPKLQKQADELNPVLSQNGIATVGVTDQTVKCWILKTTDTLDGRPALSYYVEANANKVRFTTDVPDVTALESLLNFDAYLIQDGFSTDFVKDFSDYYTQLNFSDTPSFFFDGSNGANQFKFFSGQKISFRQKFTTAKTMPTSGLYKINLIADFTKQDRWQFFDTANKPSADISIDLLAFKQTADNSPFYYLPFDGLVGLNGNRLNRQGYGTAFTVSENQVFFISRKTGIATVPDSGSVPNQTVKINRSSSLAALNSQPSRRGIILDVQSKNESQKQLDFSPSIATPVLLKISQAATSKPFSVFYDIRNAQVGETTGDTLAFWTGAGACRDFSGSMVTEVFSEKPDRKATKNDHFDAWKNAYAIDWEKAAIGGDEYLKTVFYTPVNSAYALNSQSQNAVIGTPDQEFQPSVDLQGIQNMPFNRKGQTETDRITALDDLFSLVENGQVCVTNTGQRTRFWWNQKTLYQQTGNTNKNIQNIEDGLQSLTSCIG
ncbi:MAG: carboxypeptidase-like regulatory domain-containing protein [Candidatus Micrarchaeota archaeon]